LCHELGAEAESDGPPAAGDASRDEFAELRDPRRVVTDTVLRTGHDNA
jgi:hypothetical protein